VHSGFPKAAAGGEGTAADEAPPAPPGPPPPLTEPTRSAEEAGLKGQPLTAAEQYERLKHFLPLTQEPETDRPSPHDLRVGTRLRVEWSKAWWAARVREEGESSVKVSFDTWSRQYDEWIPRDSIRLRLPLPDDKDLAAECLVKPSSQESDAPENATSSPTPRPFTPKPYNPEREFQKRQLRLREKIAAMQKVKLGASGPALDPGRAAGGDGGPSGKAEAPRATADHPDDGGHLGGGAPPSPEAAIPGPPAVPGRAAEAAAAGAAAAVAPRLAEGRTRSASAAASPSPDAAAPEAPPAAGVEPPAAGPQGAPGGSAAAAGSGPAKGVVRWEEVLSEQRERYYHELSSGRTQWELPAEGWVQLLADDGAHYYWNASTDATQWDVPTA